MLKKLYSILFFLGCTVAALAQQIQSPSQFLGYKLGDQFTYHYRIAEYFRYIAQNSKNVKLVQYGTTNEGRPLLAAFIASDENIGRLDDIRQNNMKLSGMAQGTGTTSSPVVVWLSYNVHGNEPTSSEAAMETLFDLVDPSNTQTKQWLKNTVVVIDPCLNPDGRDRYVNFYNSVKGMAPDAYNQAREHMEPWPGGRVNHYYFDLNRDWAWQTQKEVKARVALYNQWLPQVHVDFHEQGYNSPYYFAPAAEPFHKVITPWQREFQTTIGKANARHFDENGWMYFTKEEFDLLYPSYGDTYPIYNGSIGMTYEQGGISAGLAVLTRSGDTLTLAQRISHHHTTGLSTIETASAYAQKVVTEYKKFFDDSRTTPPGEYKTYIVKNDNEDKIALLAQLLDKNGIKYGYGAGKGITGYNYFNGRQETFNGGAKDMVINAYQPKAVLLNVLFEPKTFIADSNTYDITAWSLPYVYGLKTYGLKESVKPAGSALPLKTTDAALNGHPYAYVAAWESTKDVRFLAGLLKKHIKVRYAEEPFESGGKKYSAGSLIITRAGNNQTGFEQAVTSLAADNSTTLSTLTSGFVDKGKDIGSGEVHTLRQPRVMLLSGEQVNSEAMGEIWHYFEQQINYPVTVVRYQDMNRIKISDFDVIILPDGSYSDFPADKIQSWVRDGGKLIAIADAVNALAGKAGFSVKKKEDKKDDKADGKNKYNAIHTYAERDRESISSTVPGAIYKINIDNTHPLGYGYPNYYYSLKQSDDIYEFLGDGGWNVGTIKKDAYVSGFVGQKAKEKLNDGMLIGVQGMGRGTVVYFTDDPMFRSFWENGKLLFGNAVFMVGN